MSAGVSGSLGVCVCECLKNVCVRTHTQWHRMGLDMYYIVSDRADKMWA